MPCKEYNLNRPFRIKLNDPLSEISGISFYPKDSSVFAISDESGSLYKIHLNRKIVISKWKFDKVHDFEDVLLHDSSFYVLESNGNIQTLRFSSKGDTIFKIRDTFPLATAKKNEFESIYYDEASKNLVMICKDCQGDKHNAVSSWNFDPSSDTYRQSAFSVDVHQIAKKTNDKEQKFKPSAAAVNPLTKDIWILSSADQLLIVTDKKGNTKAVYTLDPIIFKQPEGITFSPWGDLLISNEATDKYETSTLLIFKPQKKG